MGKEREGEIPESNIILNGGQDEPCWGKTELMLLNLIAEIIVEIVMQDDEK